MLGKPARVLNVLGISLLIASTAVAQRPLRFSLSTTLYATNLNTEDATGAHQRLSGVSAGGAASIGYRRLGFGIRYLEGSLSPSAGGTSRALVEGEAMLSVRTLSWLKVKLGPHIRSLIRDNATERWLFWEGRLRAEAQLGTRKVTSLQEITGMEGSVITMQEVFSFKQQTIDTEGRIRGRFVFHGVRPRFTEKLDALGISLPRDFFDPSRSLRV